MNKSKVVEELKNSLAKVNKTKFDMVGETILTDNPADINRAIIRHAASYAFYAGWESIAKIETKEAETAMEDCFNTAYLLVKTKYENKKVTETFLKALASQSKEYIEFRTILFKKQEEEMILHSMVKALEQKKDMIFSLACNMRTDQKTGIHITNTEKKYKELNSGKTK